MKNHIILLIFTVSACVPYPTQPPVIIDIQESAVKIVAQTRITMEEFRNEPEKWGRPDKHSIMDEARRGCSSYERTPVFISKICIDGDRAWCYYTEFIFSCK